jgi:hypothetical protein
MSATNTTTASTTTTEGEEREKPLRIVFRQEMASTIEHTPRPHFSVPTAAEQEASHALLHLPPPPPQQQQQPMEVAESKAPAHPEEEELVNPVSNVEEPQPVEAAPVPALTVPPVQEEESAPMEMEEPSHAVTTTATSSTTHSATEETHEQEIAEIEAVSAENPQLTQREEVFSNPSKEQELQPAEPSREQEQPAQPQEAEESVVVAKSPSPVVVEDSPKPTEVATSSPPPPPLPLERDAEKVPAAAPEEEEEEEERASPDKINEDTRLAALAVDMFETENVEMEGTVPILDTKYSPRDFSPPPKPSDDETALPKLPFDGPAAEAPQDTLPSPSTPPPPPMEPCRQPQEVDPYGGMEYDPAIPTDDSPIHCEPEQPPSTKLLSNGDKNHIAGTPSFPEQDTSRVS